MKYLALIFCCALLITTVSCKKEYTCCFKDSSGTTVTGTGLACFTGEMSKSDKDDLVEASNTLLTTCGTACDGWSYTCVED